MDKRDVLEKFIRKSGDKFILEIYKRHMKRWFFFMILFSILYYVFYCLDYPLSMKIMRFNLAIVTAMFCIKFFHVIRFMIKIKGND